MEESNMPLSIDVCISREQESRSCNGSRPSAEVVVMLKTTPMATHHIIHQRINRHRCTAMPFVHVPSHNQLSKTSVG
jgi:hypothetical protein